MPSAPARPAPPEGISADALSNRIDQFLGSHGFKPGAPRGQTLDGSGSDGGQTEVRLRSGPVSDTDATTAVDFVCEEDVRLAVKAGRKIVVSERAIVTPAARDLGDEHRVFTVAPWHG